MTDTRKLSFTLPNGAAFTAEGTDDSIAKALQEFKTLIADPTTAAKPAPPTITPTNGNGNSGTHIIQPVGDIPMERLLERLFTQEDYYGVALSAKPKTDDPKADGVLAILYGFAVLRKETAVTAMRLQRAVVKSGLSTPRLGRTITKHAAYVTESGHGKAKRYGLNNPGMAKAKEILAGILG